MVKLLSKHSNITILNCPFEESTAGALLAKYGSAITITGSVFIRNKAALSGGAVHVHDGVIILDGNPTDTFLHNVASSGGAVQCEKCTLLMTGNNTFQNNRANTGAKTGGAVAIFDGRLMFISGMAVFTKNKALSGGALRISDCDVSCDSGSTVVLDENRARYGCT